MSSVHRDERADPDRQSERARRDATLQPEIRRPHLCRHLEGFRLCGVRHRGLCLADRRLAGQRFRPYRLDALEQAVHGRRPVKGAGLVRHPDRGSQYLSIKYTESRARPALKLSPAVSAIAMTTPWPRRSTVCSRSRSSIVEGHGAAPRLSNTLRWNWWTGSTTAACSSRSRTSR